MTLTLKEFIATLKSDALQLDNIARTVGAEGILSNALNYPSSAITYHFIIGKRAYVEFFETRNRQTLLKADEHFSTMVFLANYTGKELDQEEYWIFSLNAKKYRFITSPLEDERSSLVAGIDMCQRAIKVFPDSYDIRMEGWYMEGILEVWDMAMEQHIIT